MVGGERGAARAVAQVTVKRVAGWEKMSALTYVREEAVKTARFLAGVFILGFPYILYKQKRSLREIIKPLHCYCGSITVPWALMPTYTACLATQWVWRRHLVPT